MRAGLKRGGRMMTMTLIGVIAMLGFTMGTAQAALFTRSDNPSCSFIGSSSSNGSASTFWNDGNCQGRYSVAGKRASNGAYLSRVYATSSGPNTGVGTNYGVALSGALHYGCDNCAGQYANKAS